MKSSITPRSAPPARLSFTPAPSAVLPLVMRTLPILSPALKDTPRNDKLWLATVPAGTLKVPSDALIWLNYWIVVLPSVSTSVNIAPNPATVAAVAVPGRKKFTSVVMLPIAVNKRCTQNTPNVLV